MIDKTYSGPGYDLYVGDCLNVLRLLPDESVHCCVTSPPYWGLRDYGTAKWEGGDAGCDHDQRRRESDQSSKEAGYGGQARDSLAGRDTCRKCGARRIDAQIGLEQTPDVYVARMVEVFREVRRVLRDDGTLWLNLGDSYAVGKQGRGDDGRLSSDKRPRVNPAPVVTPTRQRATPCGFKPKDLVGVPWRVAFALQADGWYLRQDIIWHKPNPMPESVRDRCTKAHEYIFLLSKSQRYYYDAEAVKEEAKEPNKFNGSRGRLTEKTGANGDRNDAGRGAIEGDGHRNRRSVWTVATRPYKGAHFATFPPTLIEPCILAGCPHGGTVLDPFNGSGTTGQVAMNHGRRYIGIELNPAYADLTLKRFGNRLL